MALSYVPMAQNKCGRVLCIAFIILLGHCCANQDKQEYIVYLGALPSQVDYSPSDNHITILQRVLQDKSSPSESLIRSYTRSINGFTAKLTEEEKEIISGMDGVVSVFRNEKLKYHTTRSWDFMGLSRKVPRNLAIERDVIIGVIDSGIIPELESFNDRGFGPIPKRWKGTCAGGKNFTCNRKLIGARYYTDKETTKDEGSARDDEIGHGTHTASTAAGNWVINASYEGIANGIARGGVPSARIAMYKVCPESACMVAAFDDAIADGVDLITVSMGPQVASPTFVDDPIAIGTFHAMLRGIFTAQSAGNEGRRLGITISTAPWVLSVAASSTDRRIVNKLLLANGLSLLGSSINPTNSASKRSRLVYGKDLLSEHCSFENARSCSLKCWDAAKMKGKILMCDNLEGLTNLGDGEGDETTLQKHNDEGVTQSDELGLPDGLITPATFRLSIDTSNLGIVPSLPMASLSTLDYQVLHSYKTFTRSLTAEILKSESFRGTLAPIVASFSSRGPNPHVPEILKPDISGPGVEILAAGEKGFTIMSGTSMSCPHVAGVAAYVKSFHPDWSPSAIKSALMTTTWPMDPAEVGNEEAELAYGSGHVDPIKALNPGLVYETSKEDYISFLTNLGYDKSLICQMAGLQDKCHLIIGNLSSPMDLNYPSMMAVVDPWTPVLVRFPRRVTNVGAANSTYKAKVNVHIVGSNPFHSSVDIKVKPMELKFSSLKQSRSFVVEASTSEFLPPDMIVSASLVWSDGVHSVRSPIVIYSSVSKLSHSSTF